jgi:hypothetical protein
LGNQVYAIGKETFDKFFVNIAFIGKELSIKFPDKAFVVQRLSVIDIGLSYAEVQYLSPVIDNQM